MKDIPEDYKKKQMALWQELYNRYDSKGKFWHVGCDPADFTKIYVGVEFQYMARDIKRQLLDKEGKWEGLDVEIKVTGRPSPLAGGE